MKPTYQKRLYQPQFLAARIKKVQIPFKLSYLHLPLYQTSTLVLTGMGLPTRLNFILVILYIMI